MDNKSERELQKAYFQIFDGAKQIILSSLHNCPEQVVSQEIRDFIYMKQMLSTYSAFESLCCYHSKILIDILCYVVNFIKVNGKNYSLLKSYINQLELVDEIFVSDIEMDIYQEEQLNTDFHEIKDTRNYYIAVLLCYYCSRFGKQKLDDVLNKLSYCKKGEKYQVWKYKNILRTFDNISQDSFEKMLCIKKDKYDSVETVKGKLFGFVEEIKEQEQKKLQDTDVSELTDKKIEELKSKTLEDFCNFAEFDTARCDDYIIQRIKSNFCISKKSLIDDSVISYDSNYCYFMEPILYKCLIKMGTYQVNTISSILEMDNLSKKNGEPNNLIVPNACRTYFSASKIPGIKYIGLNRIQLDDFIFYLDYFNVTDGLIIKKTDFYSSISLKEIKILDDEGWIENGKDFVMNVNVEFSFAFDKAKKFTAYRLEY